MVSFGGIAMSFTNDSEIFFIDTNLLVYAYDSSEEKKQKRCQEILVEGVTNGSLRLSTQVLGEFVTVFRKKFPKEDLEAKLTTVLDLFVGETVIPIDYRTTLLALRLMCRYQISYWDAQILAAAKRGECVYVLSEDLSDGQNYEGVVVRCPW